MKIWGISLALVLLVSLLVAAVPASADTLKYSKLKTPHSQFDQIEPASDMDLYAMAPDGKTMFTYDNTTPAVATTLGAAPAAGATAITVVGTAGYPTSGYLAISNAAGTIIEAGIKYTGVTATTFTGIPATGPGSIALATHIVGDTVTTGQLRKSTNGGTTWGKTNIGGSLNGIAATAMAVSDNYATDSTLVITSATNVLRSQNGGTTFGEIGTATGGLVAGTSAITSVDIAEYYQGGMAFLVGDGDTTNVTVAGGVSLFTMTNLTWKDISTAALGFTGSNVLDVEFSPNHRADAQILVLAVNAGGTFVYTKFGSEAWNATVSPCELNAAVGLVATAGGDMAFPDDYEWSASNNILVGIYGSARDDLYKVKGALNPGASLATDGGLYGPATNASVYSVDIKGNWVGGKVIVGQLWDANANYVKYINDASGSLNGTLPSKTPTGGTTAGTDYAIVAWSPISDDAYCATTGAQSAFNVSSDGGATWNQQSLIDVSAMGNLSLIDVDPVDANTLFLLMRDDADASGTITAGDYSMVFKSTDGGGAWTMVWRFLATVGQTEAMTILGASPAYAEDSTVYVAQNGTRIWKTYNGGTNWIGLTNPANVTAMYVADGSTYYTGTTGTTPPIGFYKSGRWTSPTLSQQVNSIATNSDGSAIYIGTTAGSVFVSSNDGGSFRPVGNPGFSAGNNISVTIASDDKTLYAGAGAGGLYRFVEGTDTVWGRIEAGSTTTTTTAVGADSFTVTFAAAGDVFTLTETSGAVLVTTSAGTPALAYNAAGPTWTVTAVGATDAVLVTAIGTVTPCSGTITAAGANAAAVTPAAGTDADGDAVIPAAIAAGGTGSYVLPDLAGSTSATTGALNAVAVAMAADGTLYAANANANGGISRSVKPSGPTAPARNFEVLSQDLDTGAAFQTLSVAPGTNTLYGIAGGITAAPYETTTRVMHFDDTMAISVQATAPADGTVISGTSVMLSWKKVDAPVSLIYFYQVATDAAFANVSVSGTTRGTSITPNFTFVPGTTYYWRVKVQDVGANAQASKYSSTASFTPELGVLSTTGQVLGPTLQSPTYGADDVMLRPTFSWLAVAGADTYELEVSTNPFFAMADAKGPLSHTTWTWEDDLTYGTTYYWRVRATKGGETVSPWSESVFTVATEPVPEAPPVVVQEAPPAPEITFPPITLTSPPVNVTVPAEAPAPPSPITPAVIWAIIIIGAVLVIAVIVLIVRTRRVP
jgi:hypothetical protein